MIGRALPLALAAAALAAGCGAAATTTRPRDRRRPRGRWARCRRSSRRCPPPPTTRSPPEKFALGQALFFDKRLSRTGEIACGSCHLQANAFADPRRVSEGIEGRTGTRNAPPLFNLA